MTITNGQTKPRGGEGKHHARNEPMIRPEDVDAAIGPDAATLSPAERFERFVRRIMGQPKPADCNDQDVGTLG